MQENLGGNDSQQKIRDTFSILKLQFFMIMEKDFSMSFVCRVLNLNKSRARQEFMLYWYQDKHNYSQS